MSEQRVIRPTPISGFPEWLPEIRSVEQRWLDHIRAGFERYGFASIETPSVENLDVLMAKGETSKEVYTLHRVQDDEGEDSEARLGLHFDLTVPFARYVAQHFNELAFPFKRYQIQRVWRGERPQEGRYREFTQCDIDVINVDGVPLHFDAEMPRVVHEVLAGLDLPAWTLNINNRKVLQGFYEGLGIADPLAVIRAVDKLHKIGDDGVRAILADEGLTAAQADSCLELARVKGADRSVVDEVAKLGAESDLLTEGLEELGFVLDSLADLPEGSVAADLSIARGLDYYTGTVYEAAFDDDPGYGSIVAGGRYENLAGQFIRRNLPGVGISVGLTRIFAKLVAEGRLPAGRTCPTDVLVAVPSAERREEALRTGALLRGRGFNTEVFHQASKVGKQLQYASKKGIPFVWFPPFADGRPHEVKDMATGEQAEADPAAWERPAR
ncbi:histidine--tRNA ligase [Nocardiopsis suaedae]|uniref:Histidine--tRNA ligase n=1 Tax=Nocardiopsis suaedae TaxID=3018444 RepID=A0ABT4TNS7_9ACTN|nr:histidine--tRNA ligase [Nocardiopsis suaedae]MDA2806336.1 histidine--tRNA ligase [Nocardiopsis suaedae]